MTDCSNADVRDLLPDLINDRLSASERRVAESHLAVCEDCRAELALLRRLRAEQVTPTVDTQAIVAALPSYRSSARRAWPGWRIAAGIAVLAVGASSALVARGVRTQRPEGATASSAVAAANAAVRNAPPASLPELAPAPERADSGADTRRAAHDSLVSSRELAMTGGALNDLNDRELAALLREIEAMDALPSVDVEAAPVVPLSPRGSEQ